MERRTRRLSQALLLGAGPHIIVVVENQTESKGADKSVEEK